MIYIICFQALFDYQPSKDDEQQVIAWLTLMEKAYCHFQRYIHVDIDIDIDNNIFLPPVAFDIVHLQLYIS